MKCKVHTHQVHWFLLFITERSSASSKKVNTFKQQIDPGHKLSRREGKSCCEKLKVSSACSTSVYRIDTPLNCWLHGVRKHLEVSTVEAPYYCRLGGGDQIQGKTKGPGVLMLFMLLSVVAGVIEF